MGAVKRTHKTARMIQQLRKSLRLFSQKMGWPGKQYIVGIDLATGSDKTGMWRAPHD